MRNTEDNITFLVLDITLSSPQKLWRRSITWSGEFSNCFHSLHEKYEKTYLCQFFKSRSGLVEAKIRFLILQLEKNPYISTVHIFPKSFGAAANDSCVDWTRLLFFSEKGSLSSLCVVFADRISSSQNGSLDSFSSKAKRPTLISLVIFNSSSAMV